ncbi:ATP-binding cassette domain-containing protein [Loigolactobacillus binensis]|uniref:ATP-binding cassette domain-containing protein n=1 Tax=Loigolactobacillus binensis TaxID=2559922 RepID=A0ABW3ECF3_9LACO|nr:ABC transporter ATP-binding protein [Loigolactobacillus binensis]
MLTINGLQKHYPDFDLDVSFNVPDGQIVGLIGRNGAGKSTTFQTILGLIQPDSGELKLFGHPLNTLTATDKAKIGATFPDSFFAETLTINALSKILAATYTTAFDATAFLHTAAQQQLPLNKPLRDFSTGMKAKVKLLVALSHQAQFLVLDEPTSGLDVVVRQEIIGLLQDYLAADESRSILISSHISSDLEQLADVIIMIDAGKIVLQEDTDVLLNDYGIIKVTADAFATLDKKQLIATRKTAYGYAGLTNQRQYYQENYPQLAIEKGSLDELLLLLTKEDDVQ